jgi:hypothetical protein
VPLKQFRRFGQLFLGQPGLGPQLPQQPGERRRRLLSHDPTPPSHPSAAANRHQADGLSTRLRRSCLPRHLPATPAGGMR